MSSQQQSMAKAIPKRRNTASGFHLCGSCRKAFLTSSEMKNHTCSQSLEKPLTSPPRKSVLPQNSYLGKPVPRRLNTSNGFHLCGSCRKAFFTSSELKKHVCSQSLEKPLTPPPCTSLLPQNSDIDTAVTDKCNSNIDQDQPATVVYLVPNSQDQGEMHQRQEKNVTFASPTKSDSYSQFAKPLSVGSQQKTGPKKNYACSQSLEKPLTPTPHTLLLPQNSDINTAVTDKCNSNVVQDQQVAAVYLVRNSHHQGEMHQDVNVNIASLTKSASYSEFAKPLSVCSQHKPRPKHVKKADFTLYCNMCGLDFFTSSGLKKHKCGPPKLKPVPKKNLSSKETLLPSYRLILPKLPEPNVNNFVDPKNEVSQAVNEIELSNSTCLTEKQDVHHEEGRNLAPSCEQSEKLPALGSHQDAVSSGDVENCGAFHLCSLCGKVFFTISEHKEHTCGRPEDQQGPSPADEVSQKPMLESQTDLNVGEVPIDCGRKLGQISVLKACSSSSTGIKPDPYGPGRTSTSAPNHHSLDDNIADTKYPASSMSPEKTTKVGSVKKKYSCPSCGKRFPSSAHLKVHFVIHTGKKPYTCPTCNRGFSQEKSRQEHMYTHKQWPHVCLQCKKGFPSQSVLKVHMSIHTVKKHHVCQLCGKQFMKASHLKDHLLTHTSEKPHKCGECGKGFKCVSDLKSHTKFHTKKSPDLSPVIELKDRVFCGTAEHESTHPISIKIAMQTNPQGDISHSKETDCYSKCSDCDEELGSIYEQDNHICGRTSDAFRQTLSDIEEKPNVASALNILGDKDSNKRVKPEVMGEQRISAVQLQHTGFDNLDSVSGIDNNACSQAVPDHCLPVPSTTKLNCSAGLIAGSNDKRETVQNGFNMIHEIVNPDLCQKSRADKGISTDSVYTTDVQDRMKNVMMDTNFNQSDKSNVQYNLMFVLKKVNGNQGKPSIPPGKILLPSLGQERYQRPCSKTPSSRKVHHCSQCGKLFRSKAEVKRHEYVHTGEKPHVCKICGQGFRQLGTLKLHRYAHTGDWPCVCKVCGKGFSNGTPLRRHMQIHTGLKPHICGVCGTGFSRAYNLKAHLYTHTGSNPLTCIVCGKGFTRMDHLKRHLKVHTHEAQLKNSEENKIGHAAYMRDTLEGETLFERCETCIWGFISGEELMNHLSDSHM